MMNGSTVYMISIGRLYLTCCGRRAASARLRWKIIAHRMPPQTTMPTAQAAIHEPCHICRTTTPCWVMGTRKPCRGKALDVQPVVAMARPTSRTLSDAQRRFGRRLLAPSRGALRMELTDCLPSGFCRLPSRVIACPTGCRCKQYNATVRDRPVPPPELGSDSHDQLRGRRGPAGRLGHRPPGPCLAVGARLWGSLMARR